jgi:hypothetical protein
MRGYFELKKTHQDFSDSYVLKNIVCSNAIQPNEYTLTCTFSKIKLMIMMHAAFRRLRTYMRRSLSESRRLTTLKVLNDRYITEQGLHMKILKLSRLW